MDGYAASTTNRKTFSDLQTLDAEPQMSVDKEALRQDLHRDLRTVLSDRMKKDTEIQTIRRLLAMDPADKPLWEGAPELVFPVIRSKAEGISASFLASFNQEQLFVADPQTESATKDVPTWEATVRKHLILTNTGKQLSMGLEEGVKVGCGVIKIYGKHRGRKPVMGMEVVRLEDFYMHPVTDTTLEEASTFERLLLPYWKIEQLEQAGVFDPGTCQKLKSNITNLTEEQKRNNMQGNTFMSKTNKMYEIWECYYRYQGVMYHAYYNYLDTFMLKLELSEFTEAFVNDDAGLPDQAPYFPIRPLPAPKDFYGDSYTKVILGPQKYTDWVLNARIAGGQLRLAPPIIAEEDSPLYRTLSGTGIQPGQILGVVGEPKLAYDVMQLPQENFSMEEMNLMEHISDRATISDQHLGTLAPQPRVSATAASMSNQAAGLQSDKGYSYMLNDLEYGINLWWAAFAHFIVKPATLLPVFDGDQQYLLAENPLDAKKTQNLILSVFADAGLMPPELVQVLNSMPLEQVQMMLGQAGIQLPAFTIAGASRDDIIWRVNGRSTISGKQRRQQVSAQNLQIIPYITLAKQSAEIWEILKDHLIAWDVHNWKKLIGEKPNAMGIPWDQMQVAAQLYNGQGSPANLKSQNNAG